MPPDESDSPHHDSDERRRLDKKLLASSEALQRRVGDDIRDDICQHLTGIGCLLRVLREDTSRGRANDDAWKQLESMVRETHARALNVARRLAPVVLEDEGLRAALAELSALKSELFEIDCHLVANDDAGNAISNPQDQINLFRIAQEAIYNAAEHGGAKTVELHLTESDSELLLTISDDGCWLGEQPITSGDGTGLITMAHRARMVSGELLVTNRDGGGTVVECKIPFR